MVELPQHTEGTMLRTAPLRDEAIASTGKSYSVLATNSHTLTYSLYHTKLNYFWESGACTALPEPLLTSEECRRDVDPNRIWGHHDVNRGQKHRSPASPLTSLQGSVRVHAVLWGVAGAAPCRTQPDSGTPESPAILSAAGLRGARGEGHGAARGEGCGSGRETAVPAEEQQPQARGRGSLRPAEPALVLVMSWYAFACVEFPQYKVNKPPFPHCMVYTFPTLNVELLSPIPSSLNFSKLPLSHRSPTCFCRFTLLPPAPSPSSQHCLQAALEAQLPGTPLLLDAAEPSEAAAQQLPN